MAGIYGYGSLGELSKIGKGKFVGGYEGARTYQKVMTPERHAAEQALLSQVDAHMKEERSKYWGMNKFKAMPKRLVEDTYRRFMYQNMPSEFRPNYLPGTFVPLDKTVLNKYLKNR